MARVAHDYDSCQLVQKRSAKWLNTQASTQTCKQVTKHTRTSHTPQLCYKEHVLLGANRGTKAITIEHEHKHNPWNQSNMVKHVIMPRWHVVTVYLTNDV